MLLDVLGTAPLGRLAAVEVGVEKVGLHDVWPVWPSVVVPELHAVHTSAAGAADHVWTTAMLLHV